MWTGNPAEELKNNKHNFIFITEIGYFFERPGLWKTKFSEYNSFS